MRNAPKDRLFFYATDGKSVIVLLTFRFDGVFKFNVTSVPLKRDDLNISY